MKTFSHRPMNLVVSLVAALFSTSTLASSEAENTYVSVAIGAISVIGLILFVGLYKLGKAVARKVRPAASLGLQRAAGVAFLVASFLLMSALGK